MQENRQEKALKVSASTEAMTLRRPARLDRYGVTWSCLSLHGSNDLEAESPPSTSSRSIGLSLHGSNDLEAEGPFPGAQMPFPGLSLHGSNDLEAA